MFARLKDVIRTGVLALVLMCVASLATAGRWDDQQSPSERPSTADAVSAERVREGLRRPELQLPPIPLPPPTFRVEVIEKLETPLDVIRRELQEEAGVRWRNAVPKQVAEIDVLPALVGLVHKIRAIRHEHAEAEARRMVQEELEAFCATHDCSDIERDPVSEGVIVP